MKKKNPTHPKEKHIAVAHPAADMKKLPKEVPPVPQSLKRIKPVRPNEEIKEFPQVDDSTQQYFIPVREPREVRKLILESSKSLIYCIQRYHTLKMIREEKKQYILKLKARVKELVFLIAKLKEILPPQTIDVQPIRKPATAKGAAPKALHHGSATEAPLSDIDNVTRALAAIEEKLGKL